MDHILAKLRNVKLEDIKKILTDDAAYHATEGLYLEHIWQNDEDADEVLFLFRVDDLKKGKKFIDRVHSGALKENPDANLPKMTYLKGS
jgi:hypothetical protein